VVGAVKMKSARLERARKKGVYLPMKCRKKNDGREWEERGGKMA